MSRIPWSKFTKRELVELLVAFEETGNAIEPLLTESDVCYANDCTCSPCEQRLPERVLAIRNRAAARTAITSRTPLARFLAMSLRRTSSQTSAKRA